jgi:Fe-S cluster biogenesis protein NfuA
MQTSEKVQPASIHIEATPNPATMRFVANRLLVPEGRMMEFTSPEEAEAVSPLAGYVFNLPFVTGVFISDNFITVTKNDSIGWDMVQLELREYIQEFLNTGGRAVQTDASAQQLADANERAVSHAKPANKEEEQIIAVLDEYVSPAVAGDGGHIAFKSFKDGILAVSLRGSCSGCPSSMVTLKGGIENLMRQMVPGVKEVVAEEV